VCADDVTMCCIIGPAYRATHATHVFMFAAEGLEAFDGVYEDWLSTMYRSISIWPLDSGPVEYHVVHDGPTKLHMFTDGGIR
jgi:hypothetical protein